MVWGPMFSCNTPGCHGPSLPYVFTDTAERHEVCTSYSLAGIFYLVLKFEIVSQLSGIVRS